MLPNWAAWAGITFVIIVLVEVVRAGRLLLRNLENEPTLKGISAPRAGFAAPLVSVVVPAKDEERFIENSVRSILASDYPNLELIVVDDRSEDHTPRILDRLADEYARLKVLTVTDLPSGWTGKTHALRIGANEARGDILLFSDADSVIGCDTVSRSVASVQENDLDMMSIFPGFTEHRFSENIVFPHLALGLFYFYPLMDINDQTKSAGLASGSFIMITRSAYEKVGTWKRFRGEITEDVALAKAVKSEGLRLRSVRGAHLVKTKSFDNLRDLCRFWKRTYYGGLDRSIAKLARLAINYVALVIVLCCLLVSSASILTGRASPYEWGLFILSGLVGAAVIGSYAVFTRTFHGSRLYALTAPVGILLSAWIAVSTLVTRLNRGGISWRGSVYR